MKIALTMRFQADATGLDDVARAALLKAILGIPRVLGQPHLHAGLGIRKLHARGIREARVGLGLRIVFVVAEDLVTLVRTGTHEDIRRYLRDL